jgi:hypothetical protein
MIKDTISKDTDESALNKFIALTLYFMLLGTQLLKIEL